MTCTPQHHRHKMHRLIARLQVVSAAAEEVAERDLRPGRRVQGMRWHLLVMPSQQLRRLSGAHTAAADSPGVIMLSTGERAVMSIQQGHGCACTAAADSPGIKCAVHRCLLQR